MVKILFQFKRFIFIFVAALLCFCGYQLYKHMTYREEVSINLLENVEVEYTGWDGHGKATVNKVNVKYNLADTDLKNFVESVSYTCKPAQELSEGDKIKVVALYNEKEAERLNIKIVGGNEKELVVPKIGRVSQTEDEEGEPMEEIDGFKVPASWTDEEKELYLEKAREYEARESKDENCAHGAIGPEKISGKAFSPSNFKDMDFDTYEDASAYGDASSQEYSIVPELKDDAYIYKVSFEGSEDVWFEGTGTKEKKNKKFLIENWYSSKLSEVYDKAYKYGESSKQQFKISAIQSNRKVVGFKTEFKKD